MIIFDNKMAQLVMLRKSVKPYILSIFSEF